MNNEINKLIQTIYLFNRNTFKNVIRNINLRFPIFQTHYTYAFSAPLLNRNVHTIIQLSLFV